MPDCNEQTDVNAADARGDNEAGRAELRRAKRVLVVVDVVESVRLMLAHEADVIERWRAFVEEVRASFLPSRDGRLVKSLGDGLLLEFRSVADAVATAMRLQEWIAKYNTGHSAESLLSLRVGVHAAEVVIDELDVYGSGVNLAARLAALAAPGEVVVSPEVRDQLVPEVDAVVEDLGECYVKHVELPVHAYRLGPAASAPALESLPDRHLNAARPSVAVLPFECVLGDDPADAIGEALADDTLSQLASSQDLQVISSLSTRALKRRRLELAEIGARLQAAYVLSGRYRKVGPDLALTIELADARNGSVVWSERFDSTIASAFDPHGPLAARIALAVTRAILDEELHLALVMPLPTLESYTVMFGAITLMHRATRSEFDRARAMLDYLSERQGRRGIAHAWLAKWHVLRVVQGWTPDREAEGRQALDCTRRALDANPNNALAQAIAGLVHAYLRRDLDAAGRHYGDALRISPSESMAWLFSATRHAYLGEGAQAAAAADMALRLSPLDPMRYFFDSLAATALLAGGNWERAVELAQRSIRANRRHASTWRSVAYALVMMDRVDEARSAIAELLAIEPSYTVSAFRQRFPGRDGPMAEPWARALAAAGLPE